MTTATLRAAEKRRGVLASAPEGAPAPPSWTLSSGLAKHDFARRFYVATGGEIGILSKYLSEALSRVRADSLRSIGMELMAEVHDGWHRTYEPDVGRGTVRLALPQSVPAGLYTIRYRVTSADGHPTAGTLLFGVGVNGVMKMRPVDVIEVTPGSPTALQPGGLHIMLLGLKQPLVKGKAFPLTLTFEKAGPVTVQVDVQGAGAAAPSHEGMAEPQKTH
ncbi:copper(I)-binding protein [Azospirillum agricola]|uniref:copper chaperone PCu(A)C n=1 Tax=Azospirillum agricola TaxID=1720247 RepID=UPI001AE9AA8E|nr:copper chaperone PCu(A)C [Azospirillum agricola]MBP2232607.1 copper(I)-binding protein [Azospirillum agricola]